MAIKFQYNKTSLQQIEKNLKMRQRTLPIIKNKETALRLEVKRCKQEAEDLEQKLQQQIGGYESMYALWGEFDTSLVSLKDVQLDVKKVAGVRVPVLLNIELDVKPFGLFSAPKWYFDGINLLQGLAKTAVEREFVLAKLGLLDHARRKTTQKVNLFEKVQIPGYQEAIRKIKRFMEDEENLSKSSQKILKSLQEARKKKEEQDVSLEGKEAVAVNTTSSLATSANWVSSMWRNCSRVPPATSCRQVSTSLCAIRKHSRYLISLLNPTNLLPPTPLNQLMLPEVLR